MNDRQDGKVCIRCANCVVQTPFRGQYPFCILHGKTLEPSLYIILGCEDWREI